MSPGCAGGAIFNSRAIRAVSAGMSARAVIGALRITAPGETRLAEPFGADPDIDTFGFQHMLARELFL